MKVNPFQQALTTYRTIIVATMIFSIAINVLMFVSPLYMLQVYDRVLHSRSEMTLIMLTVIALAMLALWFAGMDPLSRSGSRRSSLRRDDCEKRFQPRDHVDIEEPAVAFRIRPHGHRPSP